MARPQRTPPPKTRRRSTSTTPVPGAQAGDGAKWDAVQADVEEHVVPSLRTATAALFRELRARYSLKQLEELLKAGDWDAVITLPQPLESALVRATQEAVVRLAVRNMPAMLGVVGRVSTDVVFTVANKFALRALREHGAQLVREVTETTKVGIVQVVQEQLLSGTNPREAAIELKPLIGLTDYQQQIVRNYTRELRKGNLGALERALRDKRSDAMIARIVREGKTLTEAQIQSLTERYAERFIRYRTEVIARTESIRALAAGRRLAMNQVLSDPKTGLTKDDLVRRWVVAPGERTCRICRPIPGLNRDGVGYDEPFVTPRGPTMEAPIHPQCRCTVFVQPRISLIT